MVDELQIAVNAASHVVTESRGDLCVVQSRSIEADPEIEQIATLASLAERPDLGGENVLNREGSHRRVSAPPRRLHGVGNEDVATVWLTLLDVGLDLHPDCRLPRLRGGVKPDVRDIGVLARELPSVLTQPDATRNRPEYVEDLAKHGLLVGADEVEIL